MAKYCKSLLELLNEEDELLKERERVSEKLVSTLYEIEDLEREGYTKNKDRIDTLNEDVSNLRIGESLIEQRLKDIYSSLKYHIHQLFA